jgi:hypothetical protein
MVTATVIKGLIAREPTGGLYLTKDGRPIQQNAVETTVVPTDAVFVVLKE